MKNKDITVLLVDDDHQVQAAYKAAFEAYHFSIMQALGGQEAASLLKEKKPNVILLDILMPEMNGKEFLLQLKKDPATKSIPVVILSNSVKEEDMKEAAALGAEEYIVKSNIDIDGLIEKTRKYAKEF